MGARAWNALCSTRYYREHQLPFVSSYHGLENPQTTEVEVFAISYIRPPP